MLGGLCGAQNMELGIGSQLCSLKILDVRLLWQIQTKAGKGGDRVWDS